MAMAAAADDCVKPIEAALCEAVLPETPENILAVLGRFHTAMRGLAIK